MIYLLYGKEELLIQKEIDNIKKENELNDLDVNEYELDTVSLKEALEDAETISFFHDKKAVILNHCTFLTGTTKKGSVEQPIALLEEYIKHPNPSTILILVVFSEKLDERKKIVKMLKKEVIVKELNQVANQEQFVKDLFHGYQISRDDLNLFQKKVGNHLELLEQEAEKLKMASFQEKAITTELIQDITIQTIDLDIFGLIEAIVLKQKEKAMMMLDEMIKRGEEPLMILIMLANQFRIIYQAKELYQKGYTEKNIASMLSIHPFRIKKALEKGRMFSSEILLSYIKQLAELDYQIKNGGINKRLGLELFLLGL